MNRLGVVRQIVEELKRTFPDWRLRPDSEEKPVARAADKLRATVSNMICTNCIQRNLPSTLGCYRSDPVSSRDTYMECLLEKFCLASSQYALVSMDSSPEADERSLAIGRAMPQSRVLAAPVPPDL